MIKITQNIIVLFMLTSGVWCQNLTSKEPFVKGRSTDLTSEFNVTRSGNNNYKVGIEEKKGWQQIVIESVNNTEGEHELDKWEAPYQIQKDFPYYLSGINDQDQPIWIADVGRWNLRIIVDSGHKATTILEKYAAQAGHRIIKDLKSRGTIDEPVTQVVVILDMEGLTLAKLSHIPTMTLLFRVLRTFLDLIDVHLRAALAVNTNAGAQLFVPLLKPILGRVMTRVEFFGTNKAHWIPQVLKYCPKSQIPQWYGGTNKFTPLKVYG